MQRLQNLLLSKICTFKPGLPVCAGRIDKAVQYHANTKGLRVFWRKRTLALERRLVWDLGLESGSAGLGVEFKAEG